MPLVTVILPSYNHKDYVSIAINSVLSQTFSDFEFLISDDCSTDGTVEVIKSYSDSRIKAHYFKENQGATINHKYLIDRAQGKYVALINSDDVWKPQRLEKQVAFMEAHPEYGVCFSHAEFIDEAGHHMDMSNNIFFQPNRTQAQWIQYFITKGNCLCHPSMLIRTSVYRELGVYNLALRQLPDFDMWIRVVKKYPIYILQEELVQHRRFINTGENTSTPSLTNSMRDVMESYYIFTSYFEGISDDLFKEAFLDLFRNPLASTHADFCCEKFFLLLDGKCYLPVINLQAAIIYLFQHYSDEDVAKTLNDTYHFTLQDFHNVSCRVDLLSLMVPSSDVAKASDFTPELYIRQHKAKALSIIFLKQNSRVYKFFKKIYFAIYSRKTK